MGELIIDDRAIELIHEVLSKENAEAVRIFTSGGGCCKRFEISPVKKPLAGDVPYQFDETTVFVEKDLVTDTQTIEVRLDEKRGLLIELKQIIK